MRASAGRTLPLTLPRRLIGDLIHFSQKVPTVAGERVLRVGKLVEARRATPFPPSWNAIMVKAMGVVSARVPELRRAYLPYPYPRLYEHPHSVVSVVVPRPFEGEPAVFMCPLTKPEDRPLAQLHHRVRGYHEDPVEKRSALRRQLRVSRYPRPVRRALWGFGLNWSGRLRAEHFGTCGVNSVAGFRGKIIQMLIPITSVVYFAAAAADGRLEVQYAFDHRVFDGSTAGRALGELEAVLNTDLAVEMRSSSVRQAPPAAAA